MKYEYREPPEGINNPPTHHLKEALALAGGLTALVVGAFLLLGVLADRLVDRLSPEAERRLARMIRLPGDSVSQTTDEQELQRVLDRFVPRLPAFAYPLRVRIVCSPQVNAAALPGGTILVYTGLISRVRSENELSMVIAHEIGHYEARDHLRGLGRSLVFMAFTAAFFGSEGEIPSFFRNLVGVTSYSFSRAQEEAADRVGARLVNEQYGHVGGVVDFFQTLDSEDHQRRSGAWFSTHPAHERRVERLKNLIAREGWNVLEVKRLNGREWAERCCKRRTGGA